MRISKEWERKPSGLYGYKIHRKTIWMCSQDSNSPKSQNCQDPRTQYSHNSKQGRGLEIPGNSNYFEKVPGQIRQAEDIISDPQISVKRRRKY